MGSDAMILVFLILSFKGQRSQNENPWWSDSEAPKAPTCCPGFRARNDLWHPHAPIPCLHAAHPTSFWMSPVMGGYLQTGLVIVGALLWREPTQVCESLSGVTLTTHTSRASRAWGCTSSRVANPKRRVHLRRGETEAQGGEGRGLRLHSQF